MQLCCLKFYNTLLRLFINPHSSDVSINFFPFKEEGKIPYQDTTRLHAFTKNALPIIF